MAAMVVEQGTVDLDEVSLTYQRVGAGAPLLLIHGLGGSTRWWAKNVAALAEEFEVFAVDLAGFGESRHGGPFALGKAAAQLAAWTRRLDLGPVTLVGHSMGGCVAAELAADYPALVRRLVLVDAAALPLDQGLLQHAIGLTRALGYTPWDFLPVFATDLCRTSPLTLWNGTRDLLATDIRPKLRKVRAPALVIWGEHDTVVPPEMGQQLVRYLPNADLAVIRDAGHSPMWDRPATFNRLVLDFLLTSRGGETASRRDGKTARIES